MATYKTRPQDLLHHLKLIGLKHGSEFTYDASKGWLTFIDQSHTKGQNYRTWSNSMKKESFSNTATSPTIMIVWEIIQMAKPVPELPTLQRTIQETSCAPAD
ncbi:unnamed protein product [Cylindrotheca closterium]|uniref:Uncharacterized protein n=1 Tax=Cylindrotheca closterium TaxID=2856 RepID=A0AAD2CTX2_9STRA|nr:unnamed protein product [Cylindrotheca closterium]